MAAAEARSRARDAAVAVVGSGVGGLTCAWALAREGARVTLIEADDRLGGHALTFPGEGDRPDVDLGFQVFNLSTYPYLTELFHELDVAHEPSDMSFALSVDNGRTEWASHGLSTVFAQRKNAFSPSFLRMMREVMRFGKEAPAVLTDDRFRETTLGDYLDRHGYSERFCREYLLPTTAAVWSVPNERMRTFPIVPLVAFMQNHHLLDPLGDRPRWRVVTGRSQRYVDAVRADLEKMGAEILLSTPVTKVVRQSATADKVEITTKDGSTRSFDHVVMACHSDTAAALLDGAGCAADKDLVAKIRYQPNRVILHSDPSQMPKTRSAWSSWNVLDRSEGTSNICVTYWLNHLQNLPETAPLLLCTLNPIGEIPKDKIIWESVLDHPVLDGPAAVAQVAINELQAAADAADSRRVWFSGAWLGSGFHEDGIRAAVAVATALSADGRTPPDWARRAGAPARPGLELIRGTEPAKTRTQGLGLSVFASLARRGITKGWLKLTLPDGNDLVFGRATREEAANLGEPTALLRVYDLAMLWLAVSKSDIGLGEAYMSKMFDVDDLPAFFKVLIVNSQTLRDALNPLGLSMESPVLSALASGAYAIGNFVSHLRHLARDNTVEGSRKNIEEHYDLGNDMYKLFLDETMTYSCGIHTPEFGAVLKDGQTELPLRESQHAKLDAIIRRAGITASDHVLEIGCGWGSFAMRAASTTGCSVTGITISTEQLAEAKARVKAAGLEDKINLIICDYRKMGIEQYDEVKGSIVYDHGLAPGSFDKIVSIEMLEAVGHNHLPEYFETVERMLKPGGKAVIQVISIPDERYKEYCSTSDYIRAMVFPGGHLPCLSAVKWATEETALRLAEVVDIGPDYAITLRMWRENLIANKPAILALGYPESWFRNFEMYFAYCEAGFEEKYILDYHLTFVNEAKDTAESPLDGSGQAATWTRTFQRVFEEVGVPAVVALMTWISVFAMTLDPVYRQTASIGTAAMFFGVAVTAALPRLDPLMSTISRRAKRRAQLTLLKLMISALVCMVVAGLIAFHDVLYTTRLANTVGAQAGIESPQLDVAFAEGGELNATELAALAESGDDQVHFCAWNSDSDACSAAAQLDGQDATEHTVQAPKRADSTKYVIRSPMHFVVAVLAWAACARLVLKQDLPHFLHAGALLALTLLSYSSNTRTATSALGLAIIHGVSELHACIAEARTLCKLRGYTLSHTGYAMLWRLDLVSLCIVRWVPVPVLLYPVILKAPWQVLMPICAIALRETFVLVEALSAYKEERENRVNTEALLVAARSRKELIDTMVKSASSTAGAPTAAEVSSSPTPSSRIYHGTVYHQRRQVDGASPANHSFKYSVWMALVDIAEAREGKAFRDSTFVSADGSWNVFCWQRKDHYSPHESATPLDEDIKDLVQEQTGRRPSGRVLVLTNIRCFGYVFNPVSVFYCLAECGTRLDAVVLEVSNTPWLEKRMYVLPLFDQDASKNDLAGWYRSKWNKDFHVSPFFDVFFNYQWDLTLPGDKIQIKATSTRRPEAATRASPDWTHITGTAHTKRELEDDGAKTFVAGLTLKRAESQLAHLLAQPLLTLSVQLYIHVQAGILMLRKGVSYQDKPANAAPIGVGRLLSNLAVFAVAGAWELIVLPFQFLRRIVSRR